jgi:glycosyltransferase involved in cell wall biosynthesis
MTPLISAIMPTRNRLGALVRALSGIDAQRFRNFEIVVVDDGSTDGTAQWLRTNRPDISLIELSQSGGAAAARNHGVARSRGEIVAFLDDDDFWRPAYLEVQAAQFEAHPEADLCTTGHVEVHAGGRVSRPDLCPLYDYAKPLVHLMAECPIHTLSVVACRRTALERVGPFTESLSIVHDLDWYLRLLTAGGKVEHYPDALVDHAVPGGLVTRHREWFREERAVHRLFFLTHALDKHDRRRIRTSRALFFASIALAKGDLVFGVVRLAEAFFLSPLEAARTTARRLLRRWQFRADKWRAAEAEQAQ